MFNFRKNGVFIHRDVDQVVTRGDIQTTFTGKRSGVLFIVGTAPCVHDDLRQACKLRPKHDICLINEATGLMRGDMLATCHPEKLDLFLDLYRAKFGDDDIEVHAIHSRVKQHVPRVDHYWRGFRSGAGSAFFAVKMAAFMGYDEIILVGCPMNGADGYYNQATTSHNKDEHRIGDVSTAVTMGYKAAIVRMKKRGMLENVRSMSGFTREKLGAPEPMRATA